MHPGMQLPDQVQASIDSVSISSHTDNETEETTVNLTVNFTAKDADGNYIPNLADVGSNNRFLYLRFALSELQPLVSELPGGTDPFWVNYTTRDAAPSGTPIDQNLVDNLDGTYQYTLWTNLASKYEPTWTHRLLLMVFGTITEQSNNVTHDFVPEQIPGPYEFATTRNVVTTAACNTCHGRLGSPLGDASFHGGSRYTIEACSVCHTTTLGGGVLEFAPMVHGIHSEQVVGDFDFTEVTYPADLRACTKCHKGEPNGDFWKTVQNAKTCFNGCHGVPEGVPVGHSSTMTQACGQCHNGGFAPTLDIAGIHAVEDASPNAPQVKPGLVNLEYVIEEVTVNDSNQAVVKFHICSSTSSDYVNPPTDGPCADPARGLIDANTYPPSGFTNASAPSFLVLYALPQDGEETPTEYNQLGRSAGQPATVSLNTAGLAGELEGSPESFTATLTSAFPDGATLRAVALQGYYTQAKGTGNPPEPEANTARHTRSVVKAVAGDPERRVVVDEQKCLNCHEVLALHGGNRENNPYVCVGCHNPNLSSSGRGSNTANLSQAEADKLEEAGYDPAAPLTWPEASNNLKELVHGIHAGALRDTPFQFVRNRGSSGVYFYDWSEVTFPGIPSNCLTCHKDGTFLSNNVPADALLTTWETTNGNISTPADVNASRNTLPNDTDVVNSPTASACWMCHDSAEATWHFGQTGGGVINGERSIARGDE